jgi:hypothetical protein
MKMARHGAREDADIGGVLAVEDGVDSLVDSLAVDTCPPLVLAVTWKSANPLC